MMETYSEPTALLIRFLSGQYQKVLSWTTSVGRQYASTLSTLKRSPTLRTWQGATAGSTGASEMNASVVTSSQQRTLLSSEPLVSAEPAPAFATKSIGVSAERLQGKALSTAQMATQCLATACSSQEGDTDAATSASEKHSASTKPEKEKPLTQYIVVRNDIPLGMVAAQVAHAAGSGSERHPPEVHVVVLAVRSEEELLHISARLVTAEVAQTLVTEVDEPYSGQAMAIGCELVRAREPLRRVLSSLPLLRELQTGSRQMVAEVVSGQQTQEAA